jgi:hypothetical protein
MSKDCASQLLVSPGGKYGEEKQGQSQVPEADEENQENQKGGQEN